MPRILVVADTPWVINDVHAALSLPGYELLNHADPRGLPQAVTEFEPDVVVMDLQVASMGGMAMARSLKESSLQPGFPDVPVILLLDRSADAFLAKRAAAVAWVKKPFNVADLRTTVESAISQETTTSA
jgi:CheY-like chemotaxis protein